MVWFCLGSVSFFVAATGAAMTSFKALIQTKISQELFYIQELVPLVGENESAPNP